MSPDDGGPHAQPIQAFAQYFRTYGIGISLLISALPLTTLLWNLFPIFDGVKALLVLIASGSSFLLVGIIFSQRHAIARLFFPGLQEGRRRAAHSSQLRRARAFAWLPVMLWFVSAFSLLQYFSLIHQAEQAIAYSYAVALNPDHEQPISRCETLKPDSGAIRFDASFEEFGGVVKHKIIITCWFESAVGSSTLRVRHAVQFSDEASVQAIRKGTPSPSVPDQEVMSLLFLLSFGCAASAFVLTGLKDYLQAALKISDRELIFQPILSSRKERFDVAGAPGVYGAVEYRPDLPDLEPVLSGPFCGWHDLEPKPEHIDATSGKVTKWKHVNVMPDSKTIACELQVSLTVGELDTRFRESAEATVRHGSSVAV
jgi:hypothetical protein